MTGLVSRRGGGPSVSGVLGPVREPVGNLRQTSDPAEATAVIEEHYAPNRVQVAPGTPFDFAIRSTELPGLGLGYITPGSGVRFSSQLPAHYAVLATTRGSIRVTSGRDSLRASGAAAVVVRPTDPVSFEQASPDACLLVVRFARDEMDRLLATMLGHPLAGPIDFARRLDLTTRQGGSFIRALHFLRAELQHPDGMTADPVMAAGLSRLVMTGLLRDHAHNYSAAFQAPPSTSLAPIRRVVDRIESQPDQVVSVADLAGTANLSVRALEAGFRRHVGMPPMAYLREVRLARVHAELTVLEPEDTTAARVGRRWGFSHYGRFVSAYRAKYGATPGETLRAR